MTSLRFRPCASTRRIGLGAIGLLAAHAASAQTTPTLPGSTTADAKPDSVVLSPFVVSSERDTGYAATDTLAGTRLRTNLKDVAASISVITKEFFEDVGATNMEELLVYTTGTEVVGVGGNFSNSFTDTYNQSFEAQRESASPATRVRGLASADQTRNYFLSPYIPLDSYNTQSATINRGANAILFGFGSPAGIIENSTIVPSFKNKGQAQVRTGSYGSYRGSLDIDRVLIPNKLALRVAGLEDHKKYEQEPTYRDQRRFYGALTFKPFQSTTLRVNAEAGELDQRLPRVDPPLDSMTTWWWFGRPTRTNLFYGAAPNGQPIGTYQRNNNLDGMAGNWGQNPGLIYSDVNNPNPTDAYVAYATAPGGVVYRHLGPRSSKEVALFVTFDPLASFLTGKQILDRSIFDYRKNNIDGPNNNTGLRFNAANFALEQLFLRGNAGLELVYDRQESRQKVLRTISGYRGNNIFIDVDTVTTDGRPNPNFGRPFVAADGYFNRDENHYETGRVTGFLKHNFRETNRGWLGRLLGTQTLTGLYTEHYRDQYYLSGKNAVAHQDWASGLNGKSIPDRNVSTVVYLGPSLANAASPVGANLQRVQHELVYPSSLPVWVENIGTGYRWVQQNVPFYTYPDYEHLTTNVVANHNRAASSAAVLQGNWWDNTVASTIGWRHDSIRSSSGQNTTLSPATGAVPLARPARVPGIDASNSTFSYGLAGHVPAKWTRRLPGRPTFSLYFNESENFQLTGVRHNILGGDIDPQSGTTKEYGIGISALDNKVSFRVTRYETVQDNITDTRLSSVLGRVAVLEQSILGNIPKTTLDAIGYVGPDSPNASPLFKQYLGYYGFNVGAVRADGTRSSTGTANPPGTADITSSISKGIEIEGVYNPTKNWRLSFNIAKQEAVRGDTSPTFDALVKDRLAQWKNPQLWPLTIGQWTVQSYAETNLINTLNTAKLSAGQYTSELRKWRANFVTNYTFDRESRLFRGWGIGGAVRWQDRVSIGYPVIQHPTLGLVTDVSHPFWGPEEIAYDAWLSYSRRIFNNRIGWKVQINMRNLLNENLMIPVVANPVTIGDLKTHDNVAYRIGEARRWELTSTFSF